MPKAPYGDVGPVDIIFDYGGGSEMTIRPIHGTVSFSHEETIADVHEEAYGDAPVDGVFAGAVTELEVPMTRTQWDTLDTLLEATSLDAGAAGGGGDIIYFSNAVGQAMYENAVQLLIRPIVNNVPSTNRDEWILIYKVHAYKAWAIEFEHTTQRVIVANFKIFPSQESGDVGKWFQFGVA